MRLAQCWSAWDHWKLSAGSVSARFRSFIRVGFWSWRIWVTFSQFKSNQLTNYIRDMWTRIRGDDWRFELGKWFDVGGNEFITFPPPSEWESAVFHLQLRQQTHSQPCRLWPTSKASRIRSSISQLWDLPIAKSWGSLLPFDVWSCLLQKLSDRILFSLDRGGYSAWYQMSVLRPRSTAKLRQGVTHSRALWPIRKVLLRHTKTISGPFFRKAQMEFLKLSFF